MTTPVELQKANEEIARLRARLAAVEALLNSQRPYPYSMYPFIDIDAVRTALGSSA